MYKVFINNKEIFLTDNVSKISFKTHDIKTFVSSKKDILKSIEQFEFNELAKRLWLIAKDIKQLKKKFFQLFVIVEAAGGLVKNKRNQYLFILRHNKWDLPKGKREAGETIEQTAIREVQEECGISGLKIKEKLNSINHLYKLDDIVVLKHTHWYLMDYSLEEKPRPQLMEQITEVRWFNENELDIIYKNTYLSIEKFVKHFFNK